MNTYNLKPLAPLQPKPLMKPLPKLKVIGEIPQIAVPLNNNNNGVVVEELIRNPYSMPSPAESVQDYAMFGVNMYNL